jgi:hypothetical protein
VAQFVPGDWGCAVFVTAVVAVLSLGAESVVMQRRQPTLKAAALSALEDMFVRKTR